MKLDLFNFWKWLTLAGEPLSLVAYVLTLGCLLSWLGRWRRLGTVLLSVGAVLFLVFAYGLPFTYVARTLEQEYRPIIDVQTAGDVKWIVVLGGGHASSQGLPVNTQVGASSLYRVVEAVRLHRAIPGSRVLFSGGPIYDRKPEAEVGREVALELGMSPDEIIIEPHPRTTAEEFSCLHRLLNAERFVLVTSALHMPRAMILAKSYGLRPIPSPTDYRTHSADESGSWMLPRTGAFSLAAATFHEMVAISWLRIRGQKGRSLTGSGTCASSATSEEKGH